MKVDEKIFKQYDIRGIYPSQLDEKTAYTIARAYALFMNPENKKMTIVVGQDMRTSSPSLVREVIKGLQEQGLDVIDVGLVATPTFYYAVAVFGFDGGIMVSASHNPKEYNGLKMVRKGAVPISGDTGIYAIRDLAIKGIFPKINHKGSCVQKLGILQEQVQHDLAYADIKKIKPFKIVADPANAMGILFLEELFKHLPCKLIKINFALDGTFPSHQPDPLQDDTLEELKKRVIKEHADLGIAPDGDGDRIFFVDNNGDSFPQAILRGMMAQVFLKDHPGAKICYDIRPGKITEDLIREAGGIPIVTKVGHSLIKEHMMKEGAIFAGESSGHHFLKMKSGSYEVPMIITLKLLEIMSEKNIPLSDILKPYKKYAHSGEINSKVEDKAGKMKELAKKYKDAQVSWLDGVTITYPEFWFNVRPSNTESLLRLNLEAISQSIMEKRRDEVLAIIRS